MDYTWEAFKLKYEEYKLLSTITTGAVIACIVGLYAIEDEIGRICLGLTTIGFGMGVYHSYTRFIFYHNKLINYARLKEDSKLLEKKVTK